MYYKAKELSELIKHLELKSNIFLIRVKVVSVTNKMLTSCHILKKLYYPKHLKKSSSFNLAQRKI